MILLRLITWPYLRKHLLRTVLTTTGIVLGVALLVGMQTANSSVLKSFYQTVDRIAGKTQLQISTGDASFPEEVLEQVQAIPEIRAAAPVIEASVETGLSGQGKLLILGVDMTGDRSLRDYDFENGDEDIIDDPLVFLAQADSLIITREFADRNGLHSGSRITFDTMQGRKQFTIRGVLKPGGMAQAFGGNFGIMDIYAAQQVFGRGRRFDRIDLGLADGVSIEQGEAAVQKVLGAGYTVEPPSGRGKQFESLLAVYNMAMGVSSLFALFIGMFIIYNAFSIAVTQRRSEIGILRALGATRGQIRTLFLIESGAAGLVGSIIGVGAGLVFAHSMTGTTGKMMEQIFGVAQNAQDMIIDVRFLIGAVLVGVLMSMLAAFIPARNAARVEPVQALQKGRYQVLGAGENRMRRWAALTAAALALICWPLGARFRPLFYAGQVLGILACLLVTPFASLALAKLLRHVLRWIRPVEGALAADSLIQAPRRTSATVAALMLSLALVVAQSGVSNASFSSIMSWTNSVLNPDMFVSTSETISARDFHFPYAMHSELEQIPGVDDVQPVRTARIQYHGAPVMLIAVDNRKVGNKVRRTIVAGKDAEMTRLAAEEKGFIVGENFANLQGLHLGDPIELITPKGPLRLPIAGIIIDYSNQLGAIFLERSLYARYFQDDTVDVFRIYIKPGASAEHVRQLIIDGPGKHSRLFVLLNKDVRDYIVRLTDQWLAMTYIQVLVAMIVAVLGIVNSLTVSIVDRRRELGVLRAVGGLRAQIRGTVWMEALSIGAIGLILGAATGCIGLFYELQTIRTDLVGMKLPFEFPSAVMATLVPVILAAALVAAVFPAESAVRGSLVEALEYE